MSFDRRRVRRERGFVRTPDVLLQMTIYGMIGVTLWSLGWPPQKSVLAGAGLLGVVAAMAATFSLTNDLTDDMGPGCAVAVLLILGVEILGSIAGRRWMPDSAWGTPVGAFVGVLALSAIAFPVRVRLAKRDRPVPPA